MCKPQWNVYFALIKPLRQLSQELCQYPTQFTTIDIVLERTTKPGCGFMNQWSFKFLLVLAEACLPIGYGDKHNNVPEVYFCCRRIVFQHRWRGRIISEYSKRFAILGDQKWLLQPSQLSVPYFSSCSHLIDMSRWPISPRKIDYGWSQPVSKLGPITIFPQTVEKWYYWGKKKSRETEP